jgi:pimeloyl-ACP methyl ester carboxylesterase
MDRPMAVELTAPPSEQTRARYPDREGFIERDGVRVFYEVYGAGKPTILLLPTWSLMHSRHWKMQIPYLARHCRVVTFDGRGNGRSDRPQDAAAYDEREFAPDAVAVMDATQTERAVIVGFSLGGQRGLLLAAGLPERIEGAIFIGPSFVGGGEPLPERASTTSIPSTTRTRAGRSTTGSTGSATTAIGSSSSCRRCSRSPTPQSRSRTPSLGGSRPTPRRCSPRSTRRG